MSLSALFGEVALNEHEIAWRTKDWDSVKKLSESYKEKPANEFFYILNKINSDKSRINTEDVESYNQFSINASLSRHIDCVQHTFNMNILCDCINDQMHFDYLLHSIRPGKRYGGTADIGDPIEDIINVVFSKCVAKIYEVSIERAKEYIDILKYKGETDKISYLMNTASAMVTESLIKETCPYVKAPEIRNVFKTMKERVK